MKKRIFSLFAVLLIMLLAGLGTAMAADDEKIIILYENDVHCAVEGYAKLAAMQEELAQTNPHVGVVPAVISSRAAAWGQSPKANISLIL